MKRDALDALFSDLVRERNNWICEHCFLDLSHEKVRLHCAHIVGRKIVRLRHDPRNAVALCSSCHGYFTDRPLEFASWITTQFGDQLADDLKRDASMVHKRHKGWQKEARVHYRDELKKIRELRMAGNRGFLDFVGYW